MESIYLFKKVKKTTLLLLRSNLRNILIHEAVDNRSPYLYLNTHKMP